MVPLPSHKVPRVSWYSGSCCLLLVFAYGAFTLSGWLSQNHSANSHESFLRSEPRNARIPVWALSISLAATLEIDVSFSSSGYLDVSVHRVPLHTLWIGVWMTGVFPAGFPHSEISGSLGICPSPELIAAYHVFRRPLVPRHPPCALLCLTCHGFRHRAPLAHSVAPGGLALDMRLHVFHPLWHCIPALPLLLISRLVLGLMSCPDSSPSF